MSNASIIPLHPARPEPEAAEESPFYYVYSLLPLGQELASVKPDTAASEALGIMARHGFSQLPIIEGSELLGMFSFKTFALGVVKLGAACLHPHDLPVEEFCDDAPVVVARTEDLWKILDALEVNDAVLVRSADRVVGVVTASDALRHFSGVARRFVLLEEIELALRALIQQSIDAATLTACIHRTLGRRYEDPSRIPNTLDALTLDDTVSIVRDGTNWDLFQRAFGSTRDMAGSKLRGLPSLRNDVFHFKREITPEDLAFLTTTRTWLHRRVRAFAALAVRSAAGND